MRDAGIYSIKRALPRMSWSPKNLYNLFQRTVGTKKREIDFRSASSTLFKQRWKSKAVVRAYHGDYINEKIFKRWYLPETLPDVRPRRRVLGDDKDSLEEFALRRKKEKDEEEATKQKGMPPVGSLMFMEVERRIDVFIFRCCFAHSVYEARRLVIHGYVLLNGKKHQNANTRLAPGDMVSVDPGAIRFFKTPNGLYDDVNDYDKIRARKEVIHEEDPSTPTPAEQELLSGLAKGGEQNERNTHTEIMKQPEGAGDQTTPTTSVAEQPAHGERNPEEGRSNEIDPVASSEAKTELTPFYLPLYASPWLFIPAYIEVSFATCSAIYVRHPTARPGYSEIPTPYPADGEIVRFAWEWYVKRRPRVRTKSRLARMPEDRALSLRQGVELDRESLRRNIQRMKARRLM